MIDMEQDFIKYGLLGVIVVVLWKLYQSRISSLIKENQELKVENKKINEDVIDGYRVTILNCNNLLDSTRKVLDEVTLLLKAIWEQKLKQ